MNHVEESHMQTKESCLIIANEDNRIICKNHMEISE